MGELSKSTNCESDDKNLEFLKSFEGIFITEEDETFKIVSVDDDTQRISYKNFVPLNSIVTTSKSTAHQQNMLFPSRNLIFDINSEVYFLSLLSLQIMRSPEIRIKKQNNYQLVELDQNSSLAHIINALPRLLNQKLTIKTMNLMYLIHFCTRAPLLIPVGVEPVKTLTLPGCVMIYLMQKKIILMRLFTIS